MLTEKQSYYNHSPISSQIMLPLITKSSTKQFNTYATNHQKPLGQHFQPLTMNDTRNLDMRKVIGFNSPGRNAGIRFNEELSVSKSPKRNIVPLLQKDETKPYLDSFI